MATRRNQALPSIDGKLDYSAPSAVCDSRRRALTSGAILAPGNSPGTLTLTNGLTLAAGAVFDFQLGATQSTSDLTVITGGTLSGAASPARSRSTSPIPVVSPPARIHF